VCPESKYGGGYYGTLAQFETHHRERRKLQVQQLVTRQSPEVQRFVRRILQKDLDELDIQL
jgi:hypothetical protein